MAIQIDPVAQTLPTGPAMTDVQTTAYNWTTGVRPLGLDYAGRIIGFDRTTRTLVFSADDADTWWPLCNFVFPVGTTPEELHHLSDGEVVMWTGRGAYEGVPTGSLIWRSSGWSTSPATATFTATHQLREGMACDYGGFSAHGMVVTCSEYGAQNDKRDLGNTSRFMWVSVDGAKTFTQVFDLHTTIIAGESAPLVTGAQPQHLHGCTYDPWWDRLWIVHGDANAAKGSYCGVTYCDDWRSGTPTWRWVPETKDNTLHWQSLFPVPLKHSLAMGTDGYATGVRHVPRDGHRKMGPFQAAHILDGINQQQHVTLHCGTRPGHPDIALMAHAGIYAKWAGGVTATFDGGKTWATIYADRTEGAEQLNFRGVCYALGPTNTSRIVVWRSDDIAHTGGSKVVGTLTTDTPKLPPLGAGSAQQVWVPASQFTTQAGTATVGYYGLAAVQSIPPAGLTRISASTQVPAEWQTMAVDLVWSSGDTTTGQATMEVGAVGRNIANGLFMPSPTAKATPVTLTGTAPGEQRITAVPGSTNVAGIPYVTITVARLGDDVADTYTAALRVVGVRLRRLT